MISNPNSLFHYVISRGDPNSAYVALTFDDGPSYFTQSILKILKEKQVTATFFLYGEFIEKNKRFLYKILDDGHAIGNHSWSHFNFSLIPDNQFLYQEIYPVERLLIKLIGIKPKLIRPPYGVIRLDQMITLANLGYYIVMWSVNSQDWEYIQHYKKLAYTLIFETVQRSIHNGAIVLLHDGVIKRQSTVWATDMIVNELIERKFNLISVDQMISQYMA